VAILIKADHIEKGIEKYDGQRDTFIETIPLNGKLESKVYKFNDGRYLVIYLFLDQAFLYESKKELLDMVQLE